jgi:hypothetical protein
MHSTANPITYGSAHSQPDGRTHACPNGGSHGCANRANRVTDVYTHRSTVVCANAHPHDVDHHDGNDDHETLGLQRCPGRSWLCSSLSLLPHRWREYHLPRRMLHMHTSTDARADSVSHFEPHGISHARTDGRTVVCSHRSSDRGANARTFGDPDCVSHSPAYRNSYCGANARTHGSPNVVPNHHHDDCDDNNAAQRVQWS